MRYAAIVSSLPGDTAKPLVKDHMLSFPAIRFVSHQMGSRAKTPHWRVAREDREGGLTGQAAPPPRPPLWVVLATPPLSLGVAVFPDGRQSSAWSL